MRRIDLHQEHDQQTTLMTQGTAKFRNFLAIERRGREKEVRRGACIATKLTGAVATN